MKGEFSVVRFACRKLCQYFCCQLFISLEHNLETSVNILSDIETWKENNSFSHLFAAICVNFSLDTGTWMPNLAFLDLLVENCVNIISDFETWKENSSFSHLSIAICVNILFDTDTWLPNLAFFYLLAEYCVNILVVIGT